MPTKEELLDFSRFDLNAILRGAQLTFVGAQRALQNPGLWTTQHYRQAAIAVGCGIAIRLLIEIPIIAVKIGLFFLSFFVSLDAVTWDDAVTDFLHFLQEYVLQVPLFLMALMRHITPAMDDLFMLSLQWVDYTYAQKHAREGPVDPRHRYYENLRAYGQVSRPQAAAHGKEAAGASAAVKKGAAGFLWRFGRRAALSLAVFALSYIPVVGRFALPAASFYTFRRAVGLGPAALIFGAGLFLPRRYLVVFLQTYYGQRSLMRELLAPYFARVRFTAAQKRRWFSSREGLLFGFGAGFYVVLRVPLVGVLVYGIAVASTAYLVTKITDPPPGQEVLLASSSSSSSSASASAAAQAAYVESQLAWRNKKAFLELALDNLDALQHRQAAVDPDRPSSGAAAAAAAARPSAVATGAATSSDDPDRPSGVQHRVQSAGNHDDDEPPPPYSFVSSAK